MNSSERKKRARGTVWCRTGTWLAITAIMLIIIGLTGSRLEFLTPIMAFMFFGIGFLVLTISALATAIGIAISMGTAGDASAMRTWGTLAASIILISTVLSQRADTSGSPPIHDITTDIENPPLFDAILPLRADAPNPPEYAGADTSSQQRAAYPNLVTLTIEYPIDNVFTAVEQVARDLGWDVVAVDRVAGRIEATDTTKWFRFKDDIVIRLIPDNSGTNVDVRSKSRVGMGDMGTNARRIRSFLDQLEARVSD